MSTGRTQYAGRDESVYNSLKIKILYYDLAKHISGFVRMSTFWEMHFGYLKFANTGGGVELSGDGTWCRITTVKYHVYPPL